MNKEIIKGTQENPAIVESALAYLNEEDFDDTEIYEEDPEDAQAKILENISK